MLKNQDVYNLFVKNKEPIIFWGKSFNHYVKLIFIQNSYPVFAQYATLKMPGNE